MKTWMLMVFLAIFVVAELGTVRHAITVVVHLVADLLCRRGSRTLPLHEHALSARQVFGRLDFLALVTTHRNSVPYDATMPLDYSQGSG